MKALDMEKRRTDSLLYQMIPRSVADRLRQGEPALNTCEVMNYVYLYLRCLSLSPYLLRLFCDKHFKHFLRLLFQMFHDVSVLFSDVVGFTRICSLISPMGVVTMLNNMYTAFDQITEQHNVYKVSSVHSHVSQYLYRLSLPNGICIIQSRF